MSPATKSARPRKSEDAETQLQSFVDKFDSQLQATIRAVRKALRKRLPGANELVYDNYNFFVIGYSSTERPSDAIVSLAAAANGVGLAFPYCGARLPDPHKLLLGCGSQNRFIRLESVKVLARPEVEAYPLPSGGGGKLITRSVSAKQRPPEVR
jgi:hypothetical protein